MSSLAIKKTRPRRAVTTSGWALVNTLPKVNVGKLTRYNRVYLHPVCDIGQNRLVVNPGWKLAGWQDAPYPGSGPHAIVYEKLTPCRPGFEEEDGGPGLKWAHGHADRMRFGGTLNTKEQRELGPWLQRA